MARTVIDSTLTEFARRVQSDGFAVVPDVIDGADIERLRSALDRLDDREEVRRRGGVYGVRNMLDVVPDVCDLARSLPLRDLAVSVLGSDCFAIRATLFDKIPGANWQLGWHQDNMISVRERIEVDGFVSWSQKAGVWHVEPPVGVLERILALRVHLDDCGPGNGPLRVLPGSHCHGWVEDDLADWKTRIDPVSCEVPAGGVVAMRPTILHASSRATAPDHRRVLHIEFAGESLPGGLEWHRRIR